MCLYAKRERDKGDTAPKATRAWKIVTHDRRPLYRSNGTLSGHYADGTQHRVLVKSIRKARRIYLSSSRKRNPRVYETGLHVYTTKPDPRSAFWSVVIEVRVSPRDWIASGNRGDRVYSRLTVVGEVK